MLITDRVCIAFVCVDRPTDVKTLAADKKKDDDADEPLTNEKLWDSVLKNQPEQGDKKNGDLLYEYPRKVAMFANLLPQGCTV